MDKHEILSTVERMLNDSDQLFVLSTLTQDGYPDSRIMGNLCDKSIHEIYFTCPTGTRKIDELAENPKASVYFNSGAVTVWLYGTATTTRDADARKKIWNDRVQSIYPEGVDSPRLNVVLFLPQKIRFRERTGEYIEFEL